MYNNNIVNGVRYFTYSLPILSLILFIYHIKDDSTELGGLVLAVIDFAVIVYYLILSAICYYLINKNTPVSRFVILFLFDLLPIYFYLHLKDYI
jgi:hypothetical protein